VSSPKHRSKAVGMASIGTLMQRSQMHRLATLTLFSDCAIIAPRPCDACDSCDKRKWARAVRTYDVTVPISEKMPMRPGLPRVQIERLSSTAKGDPANVSHLHFSSHTGTHVDAPHNFVERGSTVDMLPLDVLIGPAFVAEVRELEGNAIQAYDLARLHFPRSTTRLLIKTTNSHFWEDRLIEFEPNYVHLAPQTAGWLVKRGIQLIGVDYLSVEDHRGKDFRVHHALLEAGVIILEGLDLSQVPEGPCQLVCLPLKIKGGDGAPARVLVIKD